MDRITLVLATTLVLGLSACGKDTNGTEGEPGGDPSADARATHINKVRTMHLSTNDCPAGVRKSLQEHGFSIQADDQPADAKLVVNITRTGRNLQNVPEFGGFGAKASFTAEVIGAEDKVLFATGGEEGSITSKEMCEDIGDEIAEKLRGSPLGRVN